MSRLKSKPTLPKIEHGSAKNCQVPPNTS